MFGLGAPVTKGDSASEVMIQAGKVGHVVRTWLAWVPGHVCHKIAPIDGVRALIEKNEGVSRAGGCQIGGLEENAIVGRKRTPGRPGESAEVEIHGDAADARPGYPADRHVRSIRRTFLEPGVSACIRPKRTQYNVRIGIPVSAVAWIEIHMGPGPGILAQTRGRPVVACIDDAVTAVVRVHAPGRAHLAVV